MDIKKFVRLALILTVVCIISAGLLSGVYIFTKTRIEYNARQNFERSLREALPLADSFQKISTEEAVYLGLKMAGKQGLVCFVAPRGYSGAIEMLVGIDNTGEVTGVKILNHRETPGLGTKITSYNFLNQFLGKRKADSLEVKKDIDAITGATISSRAVSKGVTQGLEIYEKYKGHLK